MPTDNILSGSIDNARDYSDYRDSPAPYTVVLMRDINPVAAAVVSAPLPWWCTQPASLLFTYPVDACTDNAYARASAPGASRHRGAKKRPTLAVPYSPTRNNIDIDTNIDTNTSNATTGATFDIAVDAATITNVVTPLTSPPPPPLSSSPLCSGRDHRAALRNVGNPPGQATKVDSNGRPEFFDGPTTRVTLGGGGSVMLHSFLSSFAHLMNHNSEKATVVYM
jgi:hypothetical protein